VLFVTCGFSNVRAALHSSLFSCGFQPLTGRAESDAKAAALPIVRSILGITLMLLGVGMLSCRVEGLAGARSVVPAVQWVRTTNGWERTDMWQEPPAHVPRLHPLVVAAGQGLASVLSLVACRREDDEQTT
jgi:hypothetical protein